MEPFLQKKIIQSLIKHNVEIIISLDGPKEINDLNRPVKNSNNWSPYDKVMASLETFNELGYPISISSVLTRNANINNYYKFLDTLAFKGITSLELTLVMQVDAESQVSNGRNNIEFCQNLVNLYLYGLHKGIILHGDWVDPFHRILNTQKTRESKTVSRPLGHSCSATSNQISLEPSGDIFPCRAMSQHLGHINNLEGILANADYHDIMMRTFGNVPFCNGCQLEGFCQGQCLGSSEEAYDDIYKPQISYCEIYRKCTDLLFDNIGEIIDLKDIE